MENSYKKEREEREGSILDQRIAHFLKTWKPEGDDLDIECFTADLMGIVRATYTAASRPYQKILETVMNSLPLTSILHPKEK